jgi:hypothetical protein
MRGRWEVVADSGQILMSDAPEQTAAVVRAARAGRAR